MKLKLSEEYISEDLDELWPNIKEQMTYPYSKEMLLLCKQENPFRQMYYYIREGEKYAFFILYYDHMNIFTLGKQKLFMDVKTIGYPCSLSAPGYVTNDFAFMMDYIKQIKGGKLVLNVATSNVIKGTTVGETLPTCVWKGKFQSIDAYMRSLRSSYRRRINLAIKRCEDVRIKRIMDDSINVHPLYLNTYEKSEYKLECMKQGFFDRVDAIKLVFQRDDNNLGFVLLKETEQNNQKKLEFMLCGMDYSFDTTDLYYYMLYSIIAYGIERGCVEIDFGQTSEQTKLKFGAKLSKRYFYATHSNPFWNLFAKAAKPLLEYHYEFPNYRVFSDAAIACADDCIRNSVKGDL